MKTVALIGDSIRIGYQPETARLLRGRAAVYGPAENCRFALYTLWGISAWLKEAGKDLAVIHWNNGLWDSCRRLHGHEPFVTAEEYGNTLRRIIAQIRFSHPDTPIIFATTTPVWPDYIENDNATIGAFNARALRVMSDENIGINDLNALISKNPSYIADDKIHLTPQGCAAAAEQVAASLEKYI